MNHLQLSEYVMGAVVNGKIDPARIVPEMLHAPYDRGFPFWDNKNKLVKTIGIDAYERMGMAVASVNGAGSTEQQVRCRICETYNKAYEPCSSCGAPAGEVDWVQLLREAYVKASLSGKARKFATKLEKNDPVQAEDLIEMAKQLEDGTTNFFTNLEDVDDEIPEWKETGIRWMDDFNGGIPAVGVTIVAGRPKVGKTTLMIGMAVSLAMKHPDETVAIFTLEMTKAQFKRRLKELYPNFKEFRRIEVADMPTNPAQAISHAAGIPDLGVVIIDFADLMILGEVQEQQTTSLYKHLAMGSKKLNAPIILLAQLSGSYDGGMPRPNHVRYSRLAEALSVMIIMLYVGWNDWFDLKDTNVLPVEMGYGWAIRWYCRFRTKQYPGLPLAIRVPFDGEKGWKLNDPGNPRSLDKVS